MAADFVGRHVSIYCGPTLGYYQGCIKCVDAASQTITLTSPCRSGVRCDLPEITLSACDIIDLTLIDELMHDGEPAVTDPQTSTKVETSSKPQPILHDPKSRQKCKDAQMLNTPSPQSISPPKLTHSFKEQRHSNVKDGRPQPQGNRRRIASHRQQEDCFNIDESELNQDFDFEKNLALFDKQALYDEVYSGSDGEIRTPMKSRKSKKVPNYRHDENVLESRPTVYRQIVINDKLKEEVAEYYTDSGLVIPCISSSLHNKICSTAAEMGISNSRQIEAFGINASQMSLNLMGGNTRLHPRNAHQCPHVVVFTGPHEVGAQGIATARHLANQNVKVDVFMANFVKINDNLQDELKLLALTNAGLLHDVKALPSAPVDLVIVAMDNDQSSFLKQQAWYNQAAEWCRNTMAPIMCLCPPEQQLGTPCVNVKWSVCCVLPKSLPSSCGMIYLVDLGLPPKLFKKLGIKYRSPFCSKPFIALHPSC
ncbi:unnamed protein product [Clavelina lepadiformis]|uniref:Enhancer of mRNA-decapping protein 3 n=1 Tax=Clavelina lepadiformis TaxID=159417 RepID=A0ABP0H5Q6_CLALP